MKRYRKIKLVCTSLEKLFDWLYHLEFLRILDHCDAFSYNYNLHLLVFRKDDRKSFIYQTTFVIKSGAVPKDSQYIVLCAIVCSTYIPNLFRNNVKIILESYRHFVAETKVFYFHGSVSLFNHLIKITYSASIHEFWLSNGNHYLYNFRRNWTTFQNFRQITCGCRWTFVVLKI